VGLSRASWRPQWRRRRLLSPPLRAADSAVDADDPTQVVAVLGGEDFIYSQRSGVSEELFKGSVLGVDADVASTGFRGNELRSLAVCVCCSCCFVVCRCRWWWWCLMIWCAG
jgi:hypothetical protein